MKTTLNNSLLALVILATSLIPSIIHAQQSDTDTSGAPTCAIISNNLRYGARDSGSSSDVSILQDFLNTKGYLSSAPTGFFGHLTMNAVKAFQSANGISPTGFVGTLTRAKIQAIDCNGATTSSSSNTATVTTTTPVNPSTTAVQNTPVSVNNYPIITYSSQTPVSTTTKGGNLFQSLVPYPITLTSVFGTTGIVVDSVTTTTNPPYNPYYKQPYKVPPFASYSYANATTTWPTDLCSIFPKQVVRSVLSADIIEGGTISSSTCYYGYSNMTVGAFAVAFGYKSENSNPLGPVGPWDIFSNTSAEDTAVVSSPIEGPGYELVIVKYGKMQPRLFFFTKYVNGLMWMGDNVLATDQQKIVQLLSIAKQTIPNLPASLRPQ